MSGVTPILIDLYVGYSFFKAGMSATACERESGTEEGRWHGKKTWPGEIQDER
jgi:hypothetical protein